MNSSSRLRLVMAPLVCSLTLMAWEPASAAPSKKSPPAAPPAAVVEAPPAKPSLLKKLNPFRKKEAAPAPAPPAPAVKNSKKNPPSPAPSKSLTKAKVMPPATLPPVVTEEPKKPGFFSRFKPGRDKDQDAQPAPSPTPSLKPVPVPAVETVAAEPGAPEKTGFFSRLKTRLDRDPDALPQGEKPERPADWMDRWVVTEDSTAFFEFGPSQASGPDLRLPRGQVVKLASASRGWARVELEGGRQGYIGTDQMRQAADNDFAAPMGPTPAQLAALGARAAGPVPSGWSPIAPPPDLPDLPMDGQSQDSLLLLPPLEFEGTELKKGSLRLPAMDPPLLNPGDPLPPAPAPPAGPQLPAEPKLDLPEPTTPAPATDSTQTSPAPTPAAGPAQAPVPATDPAPAPNPEPAPTPAPETPVLPPPSEPGAPA